jgi:hypothetical protein
LERRGPARRHPAPRAWRAPREHGRRACGGRYYARAWGQIVTISRQSGSDPGLFGPVAPIGPCQGPEAHPHPASDDRRGLAGSTRMVRRQSVERSSRFRDNRGQTQLISATAAPRRPEYDQGRNAEDVSLPPPQAPLGAESLGRPHVLRVPRLREVPRPDPDRPADLLVAAWSTLAAAAKGPAP